MFESLLERDLLYVLDYEHDVVQFEAQPLVVEYVQAGKWLSYTPDFYVKQRHGHALVECKPSERVLREENQRKFAAARAWCLERGWGFRIVTERDLRVGFRLSNIKLLTHYARHEVAAELRQRIQASLAGMAASCLIQDVFRQVHPVPPATVWAGILHLAFHHCLRIPLDNAPISVVSPLALPGQPDLEALP
jgi:hypothetical protein